MHLDSKSPPARVRAGSAVLSLLATPLSVPILRAHLEGPLRMPDLRERLGGAAQTTLRGQIGNLRGIGALERHVRSAMPYTVENELTEAGEDLLAVADIVEAWLAHAPQGPIAFGSETAKGAIRSLVGGWSSTILHALAVRPLSLTELNGAISEISYPSLERRLSGMRTAHLVESLPGESGQGRPHAVTEWSCLAVAPLLAASRCEYRHFSEIAEPLVKADLEAVLILALRLVEVRDGVVASCASKLEPETWTAGTAGAWAEAILDGNRAGLRLGGENEALAGAVIERIQAALAAS